MTQDLGLDECHIGLHTVHGPSNVQEAGKKSKQSKLYFQEL